MNCLSKPSMRTWGPSCSGLVVLQTKATLENADGQGWNLVRQLQCHILTPRMCVFSFCVYTNWVPQSTSLFKVSVTLKNYALRVDTESTTIIWRRRIVAQPFEVHWAGAEEVSQGPRHWVLHMAGPALTAPPGMTSEQRARESQV